MDRLLRCDEYFRKSEIFEGIFSRISSMPVVESEISNSTRLFPTLFMYVRRTISAFDKSEKAIFLPKVKCELPKKRGNEIVSWNSNCESKPLGAPEKKQ